MNENIKLIIKEITVVQNKKRENKYKIQQEKNMNNYSKIKMQFIK